ncbi:hypothetical protein LOTGIDRAFT_229879 [Lottia gigantea]|uniref:Uncharacterized protein n=1 Tax=Lottia gigantea TaxID=225164 RepID=V3YXV6_LOTGI|nr:hypothetical protein LOTGIDRAFT_229879 [Lottia gigantea]ESO82908.1 hypothetical protein LOTGIDRAFT_229879 [Lottia gigantea]
MVSSKILFCVVLVTLLVVCCLGQEVNDDGCIKYTKDARAGYSRRDKKVRIPARNEGYEITDILMTARTSFYQCVQGKNFGRTKTDWFVAKGCAGTFQITECPL